MRASGVFETHYFLELGKNCLLPPPSPVMIEGGL
jgi:hypothetical protein